MTQTVLIGALVVVLLGSLLYALVRNRVSRGIFLTLLILRLTFLAALVWLVTDPLMTFMTARVKPQKLYILVDESMSMTIEDENGTDTISRIESVNNLLFGDTSILTQFDDEAASYEIIGIGNVPRRSLNAAIKPLSHRSAILENLDEVMRDIHNDPSAQVFLISDGCTTEQDAHPSQLTYALPVTTVGVGNPHEQVDCSIESVRAPAEVDYKQPVDFLASVGERKIPEGTKITVRLRNDDGAIVTQRELTSPVENEVSLSYQPPEPGLQVFTCEVEAEGIDEPYLANNNYKTVVLVEKKDVKVMVIGKPSWDMSFILRSLRDIHNVTLDVYNVFGDESLHVFSLHAAAQVSVKDVIEKVMEQDVVLVCDMPARLFSADDQQVFRQFVERKGGCIWFIGGESSLGSGGYIATAFDELMPVMLIKNDYIEQPYRVDLATADRSHPVVAGFLGNIDFNNIPPLIGLNIASQVKPLSETFLIAKTPDGKQQFPLFSVMNIGAGKTALFAGKGLYRWSLEGRYQETYRNVLSMFVHNVIAWIVSPADTALMHVRLAKIKYDLGERVHIETMVLDTTYMPAADAQVTGVLTAPDGSQQPIDFVPVPGEQAGFSSTFLPPDSGKYSLRITGVRSDGTESVVDVEFYVIPSSDEFARLAANWDFLKKITAASGGRFYQLDAFADYMRTYRPEKIKEQIEVTRRVVDYPYLLMLLFALIIAEWTIRIKEGLS